MTPDNLGLTEHETEEIAADTKRSREKKLPIIEVFGPTIQGEGAMAGVRTTFIRFGLCDYKCTMCDSMHAVDPKRVSANARWLLPEEIVEELMKVQGTKQDLYTLNADWVTLSGGNPAIHDLTTLVKMIKGLDIIQGDIKIAIETQGTLLPDWLHLCDLITVSPKSPGMGEKFEESLFLKHLWTFKHHRNFSVKVVIFSAADLEFAKHINDLMTDCYGALPTNLYLSLGNPYPPGKDKIMGNMWEETHPEEVLKLNLLENYRQLTEILLEDHHLKNAIWLPQLHVLTWGNKQGV